MRRKTSPPYCFLETAIPVKHETLDKHFKPVTVTRIYRFDSWWPAKNLEELILAAKHNIERHGWKSDAKAGTVNGVPMRLVRSNYYQNEQFTAKELNAPPGYRYWRVDLENNTVDLLCMWDHDQKRMQADSQLWQQAVTDPRYIPPMTVQLPKGWVMTYSKTRQPDKSITKTPVISGYLEDRISKVSLGFEDAYAKLGEMMSENYCRDLDDAFGWPGQDEIVSMVFKRKPLSGTKKVGFWEVAGKRFKHSPKVLYRTMSYFGATKLTELYKGHLVRIHHPKGLAFADIGTWKCEMEIRLYVDKSKCQQVKPAPFVQAGAPGSDSGRIKAPVAAMQWYRLLIRLLETKTMIYSGNNFEV